jgi:hypothetical protein
MVAIENLPAMLSNRRISDRSRVRLQACRSLVIPPTQALPDGGSTLHALSSKRSGPSPNMFPAFGVSPDDHGRDFRGVNQ